MSTEQSISTPKSSRNGLVGQWVTSLIVLALIASQAWLFYRVYDLEQAMLVTQTEITSLQSDLATAKSNIVTLANGLDYVTSLAEIANRYAHTHDIFSDARLKTNVTDITDALDNVLAMRGVHFDWRTRDFPEMSFSNKPQIGFIAQEVERIYPELVLPGINGYKMTDYAKFTPILVEAIKEQQAIIDALQQRVSELEKEH